ncbi:MAG: hypothetical protein K6G10_06005 [Butyrivibrio sp.]|nr:hypothetical protein [Butyrivibrio sp.]
MNNDIFRKKSVDRISSPEDLSDYLHVTTPGIWIILGAIILILGAMFAWSLQTSISSYAYGSGEVKNGIMTVSFQDQKHARHVKAGMDVNVGDAHFTIDTLGTDEDGNKVAICYADIPGGTYDVKVGYRQTQVIKLLFD